MQVVHALTGVGPMIGDEPIAALADAECSAHGACREEHVAEQQRIVVAGGIDRSDVSFRNHQRVHRSLRRQVAKGEHVVGFVDHVGRDLARHDAAEQAGHGPVVSTTAPAFVRA